LTETNHNITNVQTNCLNFILWPCDDTLVRTDTANLPRFHSFIHSENFKSNPVKYAYSAWEHRDTNTSPNNSLITHESNVYNNPYSTKKK